MWWPFDSGPCNFTRCLSASFLIIKKPKSLLAFVGAGISNVCYDFSSLPGRPIAGWWLSQLPDYKSIWRRFHEFSSFFQSHFFRNSAGEFFVRYHYQRVSKINKYITSKAEAAKRRARAFIPWSFDSIFF